MSKKVISILLSAAMVAATACVGTVAASAENSGKATYYFVAPDEYFATNDQVGFYYFGSEVECAKWPGEVAVAAPEVGEHVYAATIPDDATYIIFNANVDAGTPADPELAKVAHQTVDIDTGEGENAGSVYVLMNDEAHKKTNDFSGATTTSGDWFTVEEYKNSENYKTYGFKDDTTSEVTSTVSETTSTADKTATPDTGDKQDTVAKKYHKDDIITVEYKVGNVDGIGSVGSILSYNDQYVTLESKEKAKGIEGATLLANEKAVAGQIKIAGTFDPEGNTHELASAPVALWTFTFKAVKDFNVEDLGITLTTDKLVQITDEGANTVQLVSSVNDDASKYVSNTVDVKCDHVTSEPTSSTPSVISTPSSDKDTTTSTTSTTSTKSSDSDKKGTADTATKTSSTASGKTASGSSTPSTVQTAGTFAVVSLVVILMAAAAVVLYTRKKTEE